MEVQKTLLKQGREHKQKAEKRVKKKLRLANEATAKERAASILSSQRNRSVGATSAQHRSESRELGMKPTNLMHPKSTIARTIMKAGKQPRAVE